MTEKAFLKISSGLEDALRTAKEHVDAMTPEERAAMIEEQKKSFVRGEMGWPKAKFKWVDGVKVYESYEDYCND